MAPPSPRKAEYSPSRRWMEQDCYDKVLKVSDDRQSATRAPASLIASAPPKRHTSPPREVMKTVEQKKKPSLSVDSWMKESHRTIPNTRVARTPQSAGPHWGMKTIPNEKKGRASRGRDSHWGMKTLEKKAPLVRDGGWVSDKHAHHHGKVPTNVKVVPFHRHTQVDHHRQTSPHSRDRLSHATTA